MRDFHIKNNTLAIAGDFGVLKWINFIQQINLAAPKFHITNIISDKGEYNYGEKLFPTIKRDL